MVSPYWSAVSLRTTAAFVSSPGEIPNTEIFLSASFAASAVRFASPSPVGAALSK